MPEASDRSSHSRVPGLDLLRLAAVAAVIFYHYGFWGPASHGESQVAIPALAAYAQYGFMGVPVFFAISGFVIAYSAEGRTPIGFAIARFSRIYPTFVLCMTMTFIVTLLLGGGHFEITVGQWAANLLIAAPALGQPYVDTAYWSLVIEVIFYAWVTVFLALGLFPRRIDVIVLAWLAITFANELTIDAPVVEKVFMADDSGFFAVGLMIYEYHRGRRDMRLCGMFVLAAATAVFQAVHKLERLGVHVGSSFDPRVVAVICIVSILVVFWLTRIRRIPLPAGLVLACGGITYPLYLLHMQAGYVVLMAFRPATSVEISTAVIIAGAVALAWTVWRLFERPVQRRVKSILTTQAARLGWHPATPDAGGQLSN